MVNQQCGHCNKICNHILEVCPHCKATKEFGDITGMTYWLPEAPTAWKPANTFLITDTIYNPGTPYKSMNVKERIENAERELRLAKEALKGGNALYESLLNMSIDSANISSYSNGYKVSGGYSIYVECLPTDKHYHISVDNEELHIYPTT